MSAKINPTMPTNLAAVRSHKMKMAAQMTLPMYGKIGGRAESVGSIAMPRNTRNPNTAMNARNRLMAPMASDSSLRESAGSRSLDRLEHSPGESQELA